MTRHTAGNWRVVGEFDAEVSVSIVTDHPTLGEIEIVEIEPVMEEWAEDEIANVQLMASSPKLLLAVEEFLTYCHGGHRYASGATEDYCTGKRCTRLRNLIASVKGNAA